jgi:hypothetical protein
MSDKKRLGLALTANEAFIKDLQKVLSVPPPLLQEVGNYVNTDKGIEVLDTETLLTMWRKYSLSPDDLSSALSLIKHLFNEETKKEIATEALIEELSEFCAERNISGVDERKEALRAFLTPKPEFLKRMQFIDFANGVLPSIVGVSGTVQLRAAFSEKNSTEIKGYVPIVEIRLRAANPDKEDDEYFIFQSDEPSFAKFIKFLKNYEDQLKIVKKSVENKLDVYTRPEKEEGK